MSGGGTIQGTGASFWRVYMAEYKEAVQRYTDFPENGTSEIDVLDAFVEFWLDFKAKFQKSRKPLDLVDRMEFPGLPALAAIKKGEWGAYFRLNLLDPDHPILDGVRVLKDGRELQRNLATALNA